MRRRQTAATTEVPRAGWACRWFQEGQRELPFFLGRFKCRAYPDATQRACRSAGRAHVRVCPGAAPRGRASPATGRLRPAQDLRKLDHQRRCIAMAKVSPAVPGRHMQSGRNKLAGAHCLATTRPGSRRPACVETRHACERKSPSALDRLAQRRPVRTYQRLGTAASQGLCWYPTPELAFGLGGWQSFHRAVLPPHGRANILEGFSAGFAGLWRRNFSAPAAPFGG